MKNMIRADFTDMAISAAPPLQSSKRILIVEDDELCVKLLDRILTRIGYTVRAYRCTENILILIENFKPDLVLLDYSLPILNGEILCNQIKRCAKTRLLPVIICSAYNNMFLSVSRYGCDSFVGKPFNPTYLVQKIKNHLQKAEMRF
ncbi:response regulator [Pedobacter hiemivivus]|uniref:Response regulator n=1 Tax=Pedobacter hiemivivus TaxID=2530454 RepID=A0A4U1FYL7_9SPHI|nr:response regulator [Pedobacter hiemivivus]TKC56197.1 response regulator [Pedobacter hiemivivus]